MIKPYFELTGIGPSTLLFIHGWGGNSNWWNQQRDYFAKSFKVAQMDLPGHGKSPMCGGELTSKKYVEAIRLVVDELPGEVILVAHSMAGAYVIESTLQVSKIKMIILVDTLKNLDQVYTYEQADKMIFDLYRKNFKDTMLNVMPAFLFSQKTSKNIQDSVIGELLNLGAEKAIKLLAPFYQTDLKELAVKIRLPVRAINSDYSPANLENNIKYFKNYKSVTISDCGHYPMLERPIEFNELLENLLKSSLYK